MLLEVRATDLLPQMHPIVEVSAITHAYIHVVH